jgi:hypothetical protein
MTITFDSLGTPLVLHPDIRTEPPLSAAPWIAAETAWTMGGKLIRWERQRKAVDIDLISGDVFGWIDRATLDALAATIAPGASFTLDYHGTIMIVEWRTHDQPCLEWEEAQPIRWSDADPTDMIAELRMKLTWHSE